ncbi:MAG: triose-phosphate isomerase [Leptospiraceae bacterium]|nr:triose-phosphate isomerase [Leptospiraceae bacterium]MCP5494511.1 triose-phosphate isomerase [Leptospiraceae bacterium]
MRQTIIAGNWKMNLNLKQAKDLAEGIKSGLKNKQTKHKVLVYPSTIHIQAVYDILNGTDVAIGCQNIYPSKLAAFTGETSTDQLKDLNLKYVLIGHSERRQFLGESNEFLNQKIIYTLKEGMIPMYCIGETLEEREDNKTFDVLGKQLTVGLQNISKEDVKVLSIAYEPVWAIGTGKVATPEQAQEAHAFVRDKIKSIFNAEIAENMSILYGGSVKPDNVQSLMSMKDIDGGLVGGASQKSDSFLALL